MRLVILIVLKYEISSLCVLQASAFDWSEPVSQKAADFDWSQPEQPTTFEWNQPVNERAEDFDWSQSLSNNLSTNAHMNGTSNERKVSQSSENEKVGFV